MAQAVRSEKLRYWHNDFCEWTNNCAVTLAICCFGYWGLGCVHASLATQAGYSPFAAFCCDFCCCYFGAAWNRMKIRQHLNIPGEFCYDCMVYSQCPCCYAVQECIQMKNMQGRPMPTKQ